MPRKSVPPRVKEIAEAILKKMKNKKDMAEERKNDIAFGTAWTEYEKENSKKSSSQIILNNLKLAQELDDNNLFGLADQLMEPEFDPEIKKAHR